MAWFYHLHVCLLVPESQEARGQAAACSCCLGHLCPSGAAWEELGAEDPISETFNLKSIPFGVEYKHNSV